ncbi:DUF5915 domain-containing protein, partial [Rossellomorea marisflavi]|uniref:DUF5915 domain-containing protein n=1 Tax=Rossellomorea marisflavi TaxID=189381 RepID=UPI00295F27FC
LSEMTVIATEPQNGEALKKHQRIIQEEINVKRVLVQETSNDLVSYEVKLNFKKAGPVLGKKVGAVKKYLDQLSQSEAEQIVQAETLHLDIEGEQLTVPFELLLVERVAEEGLSMGANASYQVILNTAITEELKLEGLAREVIRAIQTERKERDLPIEARISLRLDGDPEIRKAIEHNESLIRENVLVKEMKVEALSGGKQVTLNDHRLIIDIA